MSHRVVAFALACALVFSLPGAHAVAHTTAGIFTCRLSATKLDRTIEVAFRLRTSDAGREWRVRMWDGNVKFTDRIRITDAMGRLRVVGTTRNRPGPDAILGIARDQVTGARCKVELSI